MHIEQFIDKGLAHFSYAILSENKIALIDPTRDPNIYLEFAQSKNAQIFAVIETHTHADFVSSHMEFISRGAKVYASKNTKASFNYLTFDDGDVMQLGKCVLKALNTPGHSLDSICIVLENEQGNVHAVFTGDTLFLGDVGRPDLREHTEDSQQLKENLAGLLYDSIRNKLMPLPDATIIYPTHGAGSFCGKSMSSDLYGTLGQQKEENYALQNISKEDFIKIIIEQQPSIPKYFPFDVELNRTGPLLLQNSLSRIKTIDANAIGTEIIVDTRPAEEYRKSHLKNSINIPNGLKFETWLGSIISPLEKFYYLINDSEKSEILYKTSKIGYEVNIIGIISNNINYTTKEHLLDKKQFEQSGDEFIIIDTREKSEADTIKYFKDSKNIPLGQLRERLSELPLQRPVAIHCAGGYRSAIGSSIINTYTNNKVYDIGEDIKNYKPIE